jgi:hypothetical protein
MLPDRLMYLTRQLRDAKTFEDASHLFGIAEQILSDALGDFNDLYSRKLKDLKSGSERATLS